MNTIPETGNVYIIAGISGSGKSTISDRILEEYPTIRRSIAVTSRKPREGELFGSHYYFVDHERFQWLIATKQLLEHTHIYTNDYYGTLKLSVDQLFERGCDVLFVIDTKGVEQIKHYFPQAKAIFLKAPNDEEQRNRLERRGTTGDDLKIRVEKANEELEAAKALGLSVIINDDLEKAIKEVKKAFSLT